MPIPCLHAVGVKRPLRTRLLLAGCLLLIPAAVPAADSEPTAPPVEELVARALESAPALAAGRSRLEAAREMVAPAGALPDPTLELRVQDVGFPDWTVGDVDMSMIGPEITQDLPFPGKQGARQATAAARARVQEHELEAMRRETTLLVRRIYADLYRIDQERSLLAAGRELVELLSDIATHHIETGDMNQEGAYKARIALSRVEERRADLEAERRAKVASLNRWLDAAGDAPLGRVTVLPRPELEAAWDSLAQVASPAVLVREAEVSAAEYGLESTQKDNRPDFLAGAGIGFRGDLDPVITFRLGMELPLWQGGKQRPRIRAAQADLETALHELRDARAVARADAAELRAAWERAREQITRYEQSLVPQTALALDAARSAYVGGRADFSMVIEDFNLWLEARAGLARREAELYDAWARFDALVTVSAIPDSTEGDTP